MVKKEAILAALNDLPDELEPAVLLERLALLGEIGMPILCSGNSENPFTWSDLLESITSAYRMMNGLEPSYPLDKLIDEIEAHRGPKRVSGGAA
jgi:hypothetical protein